MSILHPFGLADIQTPAYAASIALAITNNVTFVKVANTGALALTIGSVDPGVKAGAKLYLQMSSDGTARTTTPGAGFLAPATAGVINKTVNVSYTYDGTYFVQDAAGVTVN